MELHLIITSINSSCWHLLFDESTFVNIEINFGLSLLWILILKLILRKWILVLILVLVLSLLFLQMLILNLNAYSKSTFLKLILANNNQKHSILILVLTCIRLFQKCWYWYWRAKPDLAHLCCERLIVLQTTDFVVGDNDPINLVCATCAPTSTLCAQVIYIVSQVIHMACFDILGNGISTLLENSL